MTTIFIPVETILKVDDDDTLMEHTHGNDNGIHKNIERLVPNESSCISIGTQFPPLDSERKSIVGEVNNLPIHESVSCKTDDLNNIVIRESDVDANNLEDPSQLTKNWQIPDSSNCNEEKLFMPATFPQQIPCNFQTFPVDENFFLQFDYKTRNKLKTKQRRLDPFYRSQERIRQRTVMRLKRQDPRFRAVEREKGRYRMRLKRLDPLFRSQERERQRERMKVKRRDPNFREKEREQQKSRLYVKRLDPAFKEKERAQDRLRMRIKRQSNGIYSTIYSDKSKLAVEDDYIITESQAYVKDANQRFSSQPETRSEQQNELVLPENLNNSRLQTLKPREPTLESFHYRKTHILNFNFYNSGKEQWLNHGELYTKGLAHFNLLREDEKLQQTLMNPDNLTASDKDNQSVQKKQIFKQDTFCESMKIKAENNTPDRHKVEKVIVESTCHDVTLESKVNSPIDESSLPPISGNSIC